MKRIVLAALSIALLWSQGICAAPQSPAAPAAEPDKQEKTSATGVSPGAVREKLIGYDKIQVVPFKNKVGENLEGDTLAELHQTIANRLNESKLFATSIEAGLAFPKRDPDDENKLAYAGTNTDEDAQTLLLFGEVITFNKGSRAKRYLIGGGTGRAEMRANCFLVDKKTGKQLYHFQTFGETNWGAFGGGADKTLKGMANRILDFIKGKY